MDTKEKPVTRVEAAKLLGIHRNTLRDWIDKGEVNVVVFGLKTRIELSEIKRVKTKLNL